MEQVKVNKAELLSRVEANFAKHKEIVTEAFDAYRKQAIEELDKMIEEAKAGKRIRRAITLVEPIDQSREYRSAIEMLKMSIEDDITIDEESFRNLVLDEWHWKAQFTASNRLYTDKAR